MKRLADGLDATIVRPYYPVSKLYRLTRDDLSLQIDFMGSISGIRSYEGLRKRASEAQFAGHPLRVASLADIIASKRAANRPQDQAVLPMLEKALEEES